MLSQYKQSNKPTNTQIKYKSIFYHLALIFCLFTLVSFALTATASIQNKIRVGSRDFPESVLVAEILSSSIEQFSDLKVERRFNLGGVKVCISAMENEHLDIYPDYTGSLLHNLLGEYDKEEYLLNYLRSSLNSKYNLDFTKTLGYDNNFVIAARKEFAERYNLHSLSDLQELLMPLKENEASINSSEQLSSKPYQKKLRVEPQVALKHSFLHRPDGYKQLQKIYGLEFKNLQALEYNIALKTLVAGQLDLIDSFSTDSRLDNPNLVILEDDRHALLAYQAVFIYRKALLEQHPELVEVLNFLENSLTNSKILELNKRIEQGEKYEDVASDFILELSQARFRANPQAKIRWQLDSLPTQSPELKVSRAELRRLAKLNQKKENAFDHFFNSFEQYSEIFWRALRQHIELSLVSSILASILGIMIGILITYYKHLAKIILAIIATTQTIPSLALLALLIPVFGLGFYPAMLALLIYALLPIIQNTYAGISGIAPEYIELAQSLALKEKDILFKIKLPMARSFIIAGIRTSLVICIGTATLATFVGAGGLGDLIKAGIDLNNNYMICLGAIPAAMLALISSISLSILEKYDRSH